MATKPDPGNVKVGLRFDSSTVAKIESLRADIPAGGLADMVRYLMLRGMEAIAAERARGATTKR